MCLSVWCICVCDAPTARQIDEAAEDAVALAQVTRQRRRRSLLTRARLPTQRLQTPLLVVQGDNDLIAPIDATRAFVASVAASDATLDVLPDGRHRCECASCARRRNAAANAQAARRRRRRSRAGARRCVAARARLARQERVNSAPAKSTDSTHDAYKQ